MAIAHPGEPLTLHDLWSAWEFDPGVVLPLVPSAIFYELGARKHSALTRLAIGCFWIGWASLVVALASPLHLLGEVLFSAHMVQHEVLMVSTPLLVLSQPLVTFFWAMPIDWRRARAVGRKGRQSPLEFRHQSI